MVKGAFLEPGEITTCFIFFETQSETTLRATGILEYFTKFIFCERKLLGEVRKLQRNLIIPQNYDLRQTSAAALKSI